ncbi:acyl-CoA dehydrogenase family protein [Streptomyces sp. NPDC090052]|uniref:acyl-CoA dehydrogenase family protein n=1 Tax=unclassified Streptomyces TaxID=2593676 RepID=UPI002253A5EC|nr:MULTISPECIES: acyl-CoA dehydrogenase family protein [unclassified Streptomyces]MCX4727934.1 acyl-CoA dehydrogenase family protein [Streptomyces sp. NBC_01306]WSX40901.1 acyl-CoA dehydrogenase family protein [Streptomyces sp. NBC_00963]
MSEPVTFTPDQEALAGSVRSYCAARCPEEVQRAGSDSFPWPFWYGLAELGVLSLAVPGEEGGAGEISAVAMELGRAFAPGPLAATVFAAHTLPSAHSLPVVSGDSLVSWGCPPLMPWSPVADVFIETDGERAWLARPAGEVNPLETLGNEPWGRVPLERVLPLEGVREGTDLSNMALAGYLWGAGKRVLDAAVEHARTRVQFGRAIGTFQAVAHPIANAGLGLEAAEKLIKVAARAVDHGHPQASGLASAARLSASRAAMDAAFVSHQTHGAMGYSVEGPVGHIAQRIRQLSMLPSHANETGEQVLAMYSESGRE